jgi:hypothetical protein
MMVTPKDPEPDNSIATLGAIINGKLMARNEIRR